MNDKLLNFLCRIPVPLIVDMLGAEITKACANYDIATTSKDLVRILLELKSVDIFKDQRLIKSIISHFNYSELEEFNQFFKNTFITNRDEYIASINTNKWGKNKFSYALLRFFDLDNKTFFSKNDNKQNEHEIVVPRLSNKDISYDGIPIFHPEMFPLHPYQKIIKDEISNKLIGGENRFIVHMPTGSGKTKTAIEAIVDFWRVKGHNKGFIIWFSHTKELCEQSYSTFKDTWQAKGDYKLSMFKCYDKYLPNLDDYDSGVIFVGFQKFNSLLRKTEKIFIKLRNNVRLIVVDEAHISIAKTYQASIESLSESNSTRLIGLTATPGRKTDQEDVENLLLANFYNYSKISLKNPDTRIKINEEIKYLQDNKYLAKIKKIDISADIELTEFEINSIVQKDKLNEEYIRKLSINEIRNTKIIIEIKKAYERKESILVFATSVEHAIILKILLSQPMNNIKSECIFGETDSILRQTHIHEFKTGKLQVLINYNILTTGFDAPIIRTLVIARPTLSIVLYSQMLGRALRGPKMGGVSEVNTVIDLVDNYRKLGTVSSAFRHFNEFY
jgi:DNA repair protein RadD